MTVAKYLSSLLPNFERSQINEDIRLLKEELNERTLGPFEAASEHFKRDGFQSREAKEFNNLFQRSVKTDVRGDWTLVCHTAFARLDDVLDHLNGTVDKNFAKDITKEGMTYLRANILRYLEAASFAMRYARKTLLWSYAKEHEAALGSSPSEPLSKAEVSWLITNRQTFFRAIEILSTKPKEAEKFFKNIPNMVIIPDEVEVAQATVGATRLDPFHLGILPIKLNPIYHVRMAIAEWQVARHKASQEEKKALEYRLLALKELRENGERDAKLEQNIEYTEARLKKLNFKLAQMEEE